jgi:hypothetical protein
VSIDQALLKALAKNPADRYDTAVAFAEAIRSDAPAAAADLPTSDARVESGGSMKANMKATAFTVLGAVLVAAAVVVARCAR